MEYHMCLDLQYRAPLFHVNPRKFLPQPQTEQMLKNEGNSLKKNNSILREKIDELLAPLGWKTELFSHCISLNF